MNLIRWLRREYAFGPADRSHVEHRAAVDEIRAERLHRFFEASAERYADRTEADHARLVEVIDDGAIEVIREA